LSGDGHPEFSTILKVVKALGLKLTSTPANETGDRQAA
jgi:DNA-binding phage protein